MYCIVLTRNGYGDAWRFSDLKAARLHPLAQMDDVYAATPEQLAEQYGRGQIDDLLRFAGGRDRSRLIDAFETWKSGGPLAPDAKELLWTVVGRAALTPPIDPAVIVRIIKEDRAFREGRPLRSIGTDERSSLNPRNKPRKEIDMAAEARKRIDENSIITVVGKPETGENPKRQGSKAYDRFECYETGMTVKEAKAAGVEATDVSYDFAHGFITLEPGAEPAEASNENEAEASETAPKKKKSKKAA